MQALRDPSGITLRQRQVVELIAQGLSNDEVGVVLGISPRTAKAHCDVLRQKLGVPRRRQIPVAYRLLTGKTRWRPAWSRREPTTGADGEATPAATPSAAGVPALGMTKRRA